MSPQSDQASQLYLLPFTRSSRLTFLLTMGTHKPGDVERIAGRRILAVSEEELHLWNSFRHSGVKTQLVRLWLEGEVCKYVQKALRFSQLPI